MRIPRGRALFGRQIRGYTEALKCREYLEKSNAEFERYVEVSPRFTDLEVLKKDLWIFGDFVDSAQQFCLVQEVERSLNKHRYEKGHWDQVISGYREFTKTSWSNQSQAVFAKIYSMFPSKTFLPTHVLDLKEDGVIGAHVDNVNVGSRRLYVPRPTNKSLAKASGSVIVGLSLLSSCILTLRKVDHPETYLHVLLEPGSLYVQKLESLRGQNHTSLILL